MSGGGGWAGNVLVQNVRGRNVLSRKSETSRSEKSESKTSGCESARALPEPSLHDCATSSMIVTIPEASL